MRLIDAEILMKKTILNPSHSPYITKRDVESMPTIDATPVKHGRWEYSENIYDESTWACSICKEPWTLIDGTPQENGMKYCPNCGAKMDLEG